jgi:hypothetical protein
LVCKQQVKPSWTLCADVFSWGRCPLWSVVHAPRESALVIDGADDVTVPDRTGSVRRGLFSCFFFFIAACLVAERGGGPAAGIFPLASGQRRLDFYATVRVSARLEMASHLSPLGLFIPPNRRCAGGPK